MLEFKFSSWLFKAIIVILFNTSSSEKIAHDVLFPRIIVLEDSSSRTPSLANVLIGYKPEEENGLQSMCKLVELCLEGVHVGKGKWLGEGIDTAVINIKGMITDDETVLADTIHSANLVIVEIDASKESLDSSYFNNLRKLTSFLDIWNQTVLQFKNFDETNSVRGKAEVIETYQTALKDEFGFVENLPGVFINVGASNQDDMKAFQLYQEECSRLSQMLSMISLHDSFRHFSVLKDENKNLKDQVIQLENKIVSLQKDFKSLFQAQMKEQKENLQIVSRTVGMDIDQVKRIFAERPECTSYTMLNDSTRSILYGDGTHDNSFVQGGQRYCDTSDQSLLNRYTDGSRSPGWVGPAWYRITMPAGTRIPESSPGGLRCGTATTGWLSGVHPTTPGASRTVKFCFHSGGTECYYENQGKVTNCGSYFVYYLENVHMCKIRYCAIN